MNARDLFWSGADMAEVRPNPAHAAKQPTAQPIAENDRNSKAVEGAKDNLRNAAEESKLLTPNRVTVLGYGEAPRLETSPVPLLGLRYTLLERNADGDYSEVLPSTVFHAGDRIRLSVMPNQPGYLYIIQRGTSGNWSPLFPAATGARESNQLGAGQVYEFPSPENSSFQFDRQAGTERLFLVFTRTRADDVGHIISLLHRASATTGETKDLAEGCPSASSNGAVASRDLLISTVGNQGQQANMERAVYVVNQISATNGNPMIVACLAIVHE